jgi:hypothetical protein
MPSSYQVVLWKQESFVVLRPLQIEFFRNLLDGKMVEDITAYLSTGAVDASPAPLHEHRDSSFQGVIPLGIGFTFDDADSSGKATSLREMRGIVEHEGHNAERIFPLIGGEEVLESPTHAVSRYVIDFGDMTLEEARRWPTLLQILEEKVRPDRVNQKRAHLRERWWQFAETRPALRKAIAGKTRVLMHPFTSTFLAFVFVPSNVLVAGPHQVFSLDSDSAFAILQSRVHEIWARFFGSSLEDRLRYISFDCFETFPFPKFWKTQPVLESAGKAYYEFRADVMVGNNEGLTKTYNRFHDPEEHDPDIQKVRMLRDAMDRAVLDAYGWTGIQPKCEFIPEFEVEIDEDEEDENGRQRKKKYRYRWPDEVRDDVLARLLELNRERALEEGQAVTDETTAALGTNLKKPSNTRRNAKIAKQDSESGLFVMDEEEV